MPNPSESGNARHDNLRAEYNAIVSYHTSLVLSRFTVAGLLVAGSGFLTPFIFHPDTSNAVRIFAGAFAILFTICVWILELRSRALYENLAHRGMQIEREHWKLDGKYWDDGFFSRQYKFSKQSETNRPDNVPKPRPDIVRVFRSKEGLPDRASKWLSHSVAFDMLYGGVLLLWILAILYFICGALYPAPNC